MKVYVVFREFIYGEGKACDCLEKIFYTRESAELYVNSLLKNINETIDIICHDID